MGLNALGTSLMVGTSVAQVGEARRARKAGKEQAAAEQRRADIENVYKTRQAVRQARLAQGAMVNQAALTGGMGSTGLMGGLSSVSSQLSGNLSFMDAVARENNVIASTQNTINQANSNMQIIGAVSSTAQTIFSPYLRAPKK